MTIKEQLHQLLDELDDDSAEEALAHLQSRRGRYGPGVARTDDDVSATEAEHAAAMDAWEDEGGGQTGHVVDERSSVDLDHLIDTLDHDGAVEALAYLQSLRRPRLLSEAGIDDEPGTEEEQAAAVEAWQLDRRHALDER